MPYIHVPQIDEVTVRRDGDTVLLLKGGRLLLALPWDAADALARALTIQAREAEELVKALGIAYDSAILLRAGVPLGLSSHPGILAEARQLAAWDSNLRRHMPGGIKSEEQFGRPAIVMHPPRPPKE